MGIYLNPGNSGFATVRNSHYVDKSGMIRLVNAGIGTIQKLTCVSRLRRFGNPCNQLDFLRGGGGADRHGGYYDQGQRRDGIE